MKIRIRYEFEQYTIDERWLLAIAALVTLALGLILGKEIFG